MIAPLATIYNWKCSSFVIWGQCCHNLTNFGHAAWQRFLLNAELFVKHWEGFVLVLSTKYVILLLVAIMINPVKR